MWHVPRPPSNIVDPALQALHEVQAGLTWSPAAVCIIGTGSLWVGLQVLKQHADAHARSLISVITAIGLIFCFSDFNMEERWTYEYWNIRAVILISSESRRAISEGCQSLCYKPAAFWRQKISLRGIDHFLWCPMNTWPRPSPAEPPRRHADEADRQLWLGCLSIDSLEKDLEYH